MEARVRLLCCEHVIGEHTLIQGCTAQTHPGFQGRWWQNLLPVWVEPQSITINPGPTKRWEETMACYFIIVHSRFAPSSEVSVTGQLSETEHQTRQATVRSSMAIPMFLSHCDLQRRVRVIIHLFTTGETEHFSFDPFYQWLLSSHSVPLPKHKLVTWPCLSSFQCCYASHHTSSQHKHFLMLHSSFATPLLNR